MVSALYSGSGGLDSSPGRGTALCSWARHRVFLGQTPKSSPLAFNHVLSLTSLVQFPALFRRVSLECMFVSVYF